MKRLFITIFIIGLIYPSISNAADLTGTKLQQLCTSANQGEKGFCNGYFAGIFQAYDSNYLRSSANVCLPTYIDPEELQKLYLKWGKTNFNKSEVPALFSILLFYGDYFPCK